MSFRIGYGYDVHQLAEGEDLVVGGLTLTTTKAPVTAMRMCSCMSFAMRS